mmetsp:Transcript_26115/g.26341  ORF Transcript_26115/g.26341 Transcript_26115/m.26341 type:complete len:90 (-) Transcript_26115:764-1033(-)
MPDRAHAVMALLKVCRVRGTPRSFICSNNESARGAWPQEPHTLMAVVYEYVLGAGPSLCIESKIHSARFQSRPVSQATRAHVYKIESGT